MRNRRWHPFGRRQTDQPVPPPTAAELVEQGMRARLTAYQPRLAGQDDPVEPSPDDRKPSGSA